MRLNWSVVSGSLAVVVLSLPFCVAQSTTAAAAPDPGQVIDTTRPARQIGRGAAPQQPASQQPAPQTGEYIGEDTCLACHEDHNYKGTPHGLAIDARTPAANRGCESCHGPGKAHAESGDATLIRRFNVITPAEVSATCTTCHNRASHALWDGSQHDQRNLGCTTCHSVHSPKGTPQLVARTQLELCAKCHRSVVNRQFRYNHMPVREGALTCSSCHNIHGSTNVRLLRAGTTVDESCTSCHADKRGPYLWEHAPVSESCVTCHDPHGSNNERMLVSKPPFLCQRCHVTSRHPPTVYDGYILNNSSNANKIYGRACVVCHTMIHGSNAPSGKALLR
jgi:DmsE family decaheme c-type cytochrome